MPRPFDLDDGRVPKDMRELMEGGGEPTVEELLRKWDKEWEEEEEEEGAGAVGGGGAGGATPCSRRGGAVGASGTGGGRARRALDDPGRGGPREAGGCPPVGVPGGRSAPCR